jgi:3'-5' exoribonuclease
MKKTQFVKDLKEKDAVATVFLIKFSATILGKNGKPYMNLVLMDRSGEVEARIWEDVAWYSGQAVQKTFVWVEGRCQAYQGRKQVIVQKLQVLREDEVTCEDYFIESKIDTHMLYSKLLGWIAQMQDPYYKALAEAIFQDDPEIQERMKKAPAAKSMHHAYPAGLLEHVVSVSEMLWYLADHYHGLLDRDLLLLGGFLHDIGKIWELTYDGVVEYSMQGRLVGHLVMGTELVDRKIELLERQGRLSGPFPEEKRFLVKHLILSHHGKLEYGSPKEPQCLEALVVHMVDDLDSKVNAISQFILQDQNPGKWTALNRSYGRFFLKSEGLLALQNASPTDAVGVS